MSQRDYLLKERPWYSNIAKRGFGVLDNAKSVTTIDATVTTNMVEIFDSSTSFDGAEIPVMYATSNDSVARLIALFSKTSSGNPSFMFSVSIPANAGTNGTVVPVDLLATAINAGIDISNNGKRKTFLPPDTKIYAGVLGTAVTTGGLAIRIQVGGKMYEKQP